MNRHTTTVASHAAYHERNAVRAFYAMRRAREDSRDIDAIVFAVEAATLAEVGHGASLPDCAMDELRETIDALTTEGSR